MARVLRGEVHWAALDPVIGSEQAGRRPVLVVQADEINRHAPTTVALAITSRRPRVDSALNVRLPRGEGGLPRDSWVKTNQVRTLALERLGTRLGRVSSTRMAEVTRALLEVLALD